MSLGQLPMRSQRGVRQAGFSLVELMIAMVMGLLIVLALATLLINVTRNNTELSRNNSVIENGRFTLQLLETDLSHAGFWGGFVPDYDDLSRTATPNIGSVPSGPLPDPCLTFSAANWSTTYLYQMVSIAVQVYEVSSAGIAPTIGTCVTTQGVTGNLLPYPQPKTHVLVVRHAAPCAASTTATDEDCTVEYKTTPTAQGALYFQMYRCATTLVPPAPASGFMLTNGTNATLSNFNLTNRNCTTVADKYKFVSHIYYVRNYSTTIGDGIPTLMRSTFHIVNSGGTNVLKFDSADALVEGIEGFRVELGIDNVSKGGVSLTQANFESALAWASATQQLTPTNRGDGSPDSFKQCPSASSSPTVAACSAFDLMNTVAVKLYVLARANTKTPNYTDGKTYTLGDTGAGGITITPNDGYKRHLYMQAIRLTNISMRREVPPG